MQKLVVTGAEYSGWQEAARLFCSEEEFRALLDGSEAFKERSRANGKIEKQTGVLAWADTASLHELDVWQKLDSELRFLLVYASPEYVLANAVQKTPDLLQQVEELALVWEKEVRKSLDFFQRNRDRAMLVNVNTVHEKNDELGKMLRTLVGGVVHHNNVLPPPADYLQAQAALLLPRRERLYQLYDEMQVAATLPGSDLDYTGKPAERHRYLAMSGMVAVFNQAEQEQFADKVESLSRELNISREENELSLLQIQQLQEELEHYFMRYKELQQNAGFPKYSRRPQQLAIATQCKVIGDYEDQGYCDVSLTLKDFHYGRGLKLDEFTCKLILKEACPGLEIRKKDNEQHQSLLAWPEGMADEHGPYLLFMPSHLEKQQTRQQQLQESMTTHDRQLISAAATAIADCFMSGKLDTTHLKPEKLRRWRETAQILVRQMQEQENFLTIDRVSLREDFSTEGYRHLWLEGDNLQFGATVLPKFGAKLFVSTDDKSEPTYGLEFRELESGQPPFETWPPETEDEHGAVARIRLKAAGNKLHLINEAVLGAEDKALVEALVLKLPTMLETLRSQIEEAEPQIMEPFCQLASNTTLVWGEPISWLRRLKGRLRNR